MRILLTLNYFENNALRAIFHNFEANMCPRNLREIRAFSRNDIRSSRKENYFH